MASSNISLGKKFKRYSDLGAANIPQRVMAAMTKTAAKRYLKNVVFP
jgi:hypothetical protein